MTSKEALQDIKDWIEYFTRLDYVNPIVRGEVQDKFKKAYWETLPHLKLIEKDLKVLDILKEHKPSFFRLNLCDSVQHYNSIYMDGTCPKTLSHNILSKEEFELLKEWLRNDN